MEEAIFNHKWVPIDENDQRNGLSILTQRVSSHFFFFFFITSPSYMQVLPGNR